MESHYEWLKIYESEVLLHHRKLFINLQEVLHPCYVMGRLNVMGMVSH